MPRADLATLATLDEEWLYINRGAERWVWSTHCNTEDVRWTLREHGITLAGPTPRQLVAEVPAAALRSAMRPLIENFRSNLLSWTSFDVAWTQRYAVTTLCALLTLETSEVSSKPASLEWAKSALPTKWRADSAGHSTTARSRLNDPPRPGRVEAGHRILRIRGETRGRIAARAPCSAKSRQLTWSPGGVRTAEGGIRTKYADRGSDRFAGLSADPVCDATVSIGKIAGAARYSSSLTWSPQAAGWPSSSTSSIADAP